MTQSSTNQNDIETNKIERVAQKQLESHYANCPFEKSKKTWLDSHMLKVLVAILVTVGPLAISGFNYVKGLEQRVAILEYNTQIIQEIRQDIKEIKKDINLLQLQVAKKEIP
jgi:hypothetical protein